MGKRQALIGGVSLIGVAALAVCWLYHRDLVQARRAVAKGSSIADLDVGPVEYAERGAGIPFLSIHGAGGGFDQGLAQAAEVVNEGYRVVAPSRFGYLRTPAPGDASPAAQADAHAALLARLGIQKAIVLGVSAGARSAIELTLRKPDRVSALILFVPGTYAPASAVPTQTARASKLALWAVSAGGDFVWWVAEKVNPSMLIRFVGVPPELVAAASPAERDRVMGIVRGVEPLSMRFHGINIDSTVDLREPPLGGITVPTLIVTARDDLFGTLPRAEFAAARIPGARLVVYDTGGHLLVGHGHEAQAVVRTFLADAALTPL